MCEDHKCRCNQGYSGIGCELEYCPEKCGESGGRGKCYYPPSSNSNLVSYKIGLKFTYVKLILSL